MPDQNTGMAPSNEAVSPVIGVILMIAIATVLAGVLFVIVSGLGDTTDQAPVVQFVRDNLNGQLTVVKSYRPIDLANLEFSASGEAKMGHNVAPTVTLLPGAFTPLGASPGTFLAAGDQINFCAVGASDKLDIVVRVTDPKPILVYQNYFTNLDPC